MYGWPYLRDAIPNEGHRAIEALERTGKMESWTYMEGLIRLYACSVKSSTSVSIYKTGCLKITLY